MDSVKRGVSFDENVFSTLARHAESSGSSVSGLLNTLVLESITNGRLGALAKSMRTINRSEAIIHELMIVNSQKNRVRTTIRKMSRSVNRWSLDHVLRCLYALRDEYRARSHIKGPCRKDWAELHRWVLVEIREFVKHPPREVDEDAIEKSIRVLRETQGSGFRDLRRL